jgi:two-component system cell cycle response regulator
MPVSILVIDDNRDNMMLIDCVLRAHGHSPLLAGSGAEGVRIALEQQPHLILLDIRMPGMDGYEVATVLKRETSLEQTRIVAVTASAMVGDRERIAAAGFDGYIQKPIDPQTFTGELEKFFPEQPEKQNATAGAE